MFWCDVTDAELRRAAHSWPLQTGVSTSTPLQITSYTMSIEATKSARSIKRNLTKYAIACKESVNKILDIGSHRHRYFWKVDIYQI
jgi:hypothetical protein